MQVHLQSHVDLILTLNGIACTYKKITLKDHFNPNPIPNP